MTKMRAVIISLLAVASFTLSALMHAAKRWAAPGAGPNSAVGIAIALSQIKLRTLILVSRCYAQIAGFEPSTNGRI